MRSQVLARIASVAQDTTHSLICQPSIRPGPRSYSTVRPCCDGLKELRTKTKP
jgi:hypothetical protein